jgi:exopolysaccharide biosynthesis polyprenyl glycosylphosphotransferase
MTSFRRQASLRAFKLFDLLVLAFSFTLAAIPVSRLTAKVSFLSFLSMRIKVQNILLLLLLLLVWHFIFSIFSLYESKRFGDRWSEIKDVLKATSLGTIVVVMVAALFRIRMVTPIFILVFWALSGSVAVSSRLMLRSFLKRVRIQGRNLRQILIVGTNPRAVRFARSIEGSPELGYRLIGFVDEQWAGIKDFLKTGYAFPTDLDRFPILLREQVVDEVTLALPMKTFYPKASEIVAQCREQGVLVRFLPDIFNAIPLQSNKHDHAQDMAIPVYADRLDGWPIVLKRSLDIVVSVTLLILLAPLFVIGALLIKFDSPGPVFFVQERIGLNKRRFRMYKFRTMVGDAEKLLANLEKLNEAKGPVFKIKDDPRITRIGRFLRRTSIDELPQLFNVLMGGMSLVGPRPLPVRDYQGLEQDWHRRRFSVRPGITCLWQINGRSSVHFEQWMELDMEYVDHWSLWLDLKILAKTMPAVLKGTGAA